MKLHRLLIVLTLANLVLLTFLLAQTRPLEAQAVAPVLRGRALEIVDDQGRIRATISVLQANPSVVADDGKPFPETVLLRLIDPRYGPVVKISGSERSAGVGLGGDSQAKYTLLATRNTGSFLSMRDANGREQTIKP